MLSDHEIRKAITREELGWSPYDPDLINPNSIDVRLSNEFLVPSDIYTHMDTANVPVGHMNRIVANQFDIYPHDFILASTKETIRVPTNLVAQVEGKSSLGRLGLAIHITAGFIDSGFCGPITLEIVNHSPWVVKLHRDMLIAQIAFSECARVMLPYNGRYQNQVGPQESRYRGVPKA